jgi:hypothetical protein
MSHIFLLDTGRSVGCTLSAPKGRPNKAQANEGVKKSTGAVIPSEARNLALSSVRKGKKTERDSSLRSE